MYGLYSNIVPTKYNSITTTEYIPQEYIEYIPVKKTRYITIPVSSTNYSFDSLIRPSVKMLQPKVIKNEMPPQFRTVTLNPRLSNSILPPIGPQGGQNTFENTFQNTNTFENFNDTFQNVNTFQNTNTFENFNDNTFQNVNTFQNTNTFENFNDTFQNVNTFQNTNTFQPDYLGNINLSELSYTDPLISLSQNNFNI